MTKSGFHITGALVDNAGGEQKLVIAGLQSDNRAQPAIFFMDLGDFKTLDVAICAKYQSTGEIWCHISDTNRDVDRCGVLR